MPESGPAPSVAATGLSFGLFLAPQHVHGPLAARLDEHLEQVRRARDAGFVSVMSGQHYLSDPYQMLQPVPLLARVAAEAGEMFVGTAVLLAPLHNPVEIAELAITMDAICHGRFILGLGLGYRDVEFKAFGVPRGQRVAYLEEALTLVPALWRERRVSHHSGRVDLAGAAFCAEPTRRPRPPIWVAANNDPAILRAARLADAWLINPHAKLSVLSRQMELYQSERLRLGKPAAPVVPMLKEVYCAETTEEALRDARPFLEDKYRTYVRWGQQKALPRNEDDLDLPFETLQGDRFVIGDPGEVIRQLERIRDTVHVNHILLRMQWPGPDGSLEQSKVLRCIDLIGRHVIPHFASRGAGPDLGATDEGLAIDAHQAGATAPADAEHAT